MEIRTGLTVSNEFPKEIAEEVDNQFDGKDESESRICI